MYTYFTNHIYLLCLKHQPPTNTSCFIEHFSQFLLAYSSKKPEMLDLLILRSEHLLPDDGIDLFVTLHTGLRVGFMADSWKKPRMNSINRDFTTAPQAFVITGV